MAEFLAMAAAARRQAPPAVEPPLPQLMLCDGPASDTHPNAIDLNIPTTQPYYSLQCRLRNPDGTLVSTLANPTCVMLRVGETDESRQQRVMTRAMRELASAVGDRQDSKISTMNSDLPRL